MTSKEIDSGKRTPSVSPTERSFGGMTQAERRQATQDSQSRRLARLKAKLTNRIYEMVERIPTRYQGRLTKALLGELSAKAAIRAHCEGCVGYEDVRPRVGGCTSFGCPLHLYRPYQAKTLEEGEQ